MLREWFILRYVSLYLNETILQFHFADIEGERRVARANSEHCT